jgi:hypothetical protein
MSGNNPRCCLISAHSKWYAHMEDVLMSKVLAIRNGLISANTTGLINIEVESDSLFVNKLMNSPLADRSTLASICHEVEDVRNGFSFSSL